MIRPIIVGEAPNRIDLTNIEWLRAYEHFRQRLGERYQLGIAFHEYVLLCNAPFIKAYINSKKTNIGWVKYKGVDILVVKERKNPKHLRTCLKTTQKTSLVQK